MTRLSFAVGTLLLAVVVAHMVLVRGQVTLASTKKASAAGSDTVKITLSRPSNIPASFSPTPYGIRYVNFDGYEYDPEVVGNYSRFDMDTMKEDALGVTHIEEFDNAGERLPPSNQYFLVYNLTNINIRVDGRYCNKSEDNTHCVCYSAKMDGVASTVKTKANTTCRGEDMAYICWNTKRAVYLTNDKEVEVAPPNTANAIVLHFEMQSKLAQFTKLVWWTDVNDLEDKNGVKEKTCSIITDKLPKLRLVKTYLYGRQDAVNSVMLKFPGCATIEHNGCYFGNQLVLSAENGNATNLVYKDLVDVEVHSPQLDFEDGSDAYERAHQCDADANRCCKLDDGSDSSSGTSGVMMTLLAAATLLPLL